VHLVSIATVAALLVATPLLAINHPFGSHPQTYFAGSILPSHLTQAALDQAARNFYDEWKARYLVSACGAGRSVVRASVKPGNLTVSEAHGYGMIVAALMAGHDPDAREIFDGMYAYFREHPSVYGPGLMAWYQRKSCASAEGSDSASDGDLDIAYALLLADKQWGSCGAIDYHAEALDVLAAIAAREVDGSGRYVLLGDWATPAEPGYYAATRSSDFMPDHLRSFAAATGSAVWTDVLDHTYQVVDDVQTTHSPVTGLLPDFVANPGGAPAPVAPNFLEGPNDGDYDYNACRDPWRIATDFLVAGEPRAKTAVERITGWFRGATGDDPGTIGAGYQLDGTPSPDSDFRSMAFVAPLGVAAMVDAAHQAWLNAVWDLVVATPLDAEAYYENTLKLLAMIVMSGNWWVPETVSGGCVPESTPLCTAGGYMPELQIKVSRLTAPAGSQNLLVKGKLFFPQGIPAAAPYTDGAQLLIDDLGSGGGALLDVSHVTTPIPPLAAGGCDPADGWRSSASRTIYRNRSTALDPPTCTAGSASGLSLLKYKMRGASDLDFQAKARRATILPPFGAVQGLSCSEAGRRLAMPARVQ